MMNTKVSILIIIFTTLLLLGCNKKPKSGGIKINYEKLSKCLNSNKVDLRYRCFYKIKDKKIVLSDDTELSFDELKTIFKQVFFLSYLGMQFDNVTYRLENKKNKKPIGGDFNSIQPDLIDYVSAYLKTFVVFAPIITSVTEIGFASFHNQEKTLDIYLSKDIESDTYAQLINIELNNQILTTNKIKEMIMEQSNYDIKNHLVFFEIDKTNNVIKKSFQVIYPLFQNGFGVYNVQLSHFGLVGSFNINRKDIYSYYNGSRHAENKTIRGFTILDTLLLAIWYHNSIPLGTSQKTFYEKLRRLIYYEKGR